jgi:hypothetical protein
MLTKALHMKKMMTIALLMLLTNHIHAQRRTVVVPAPQPPGVPIDGGILALLLGTGAYAKFKISKTQNQ